MTWNKIIQINAINVKLMKLKDELIYIVNLNLGGLNFT